MKHNYFSLKFIRLLYTECDIFDRLEFENELLENSWKNEEYKKLQRAKSDLPKVLFQPKESTLKRILKYSTV